VSKTAVILVYHPTETDNDTTTPHHEDPFAGITVLALEEADGSDYEDIIYPVAQQFPNARFHIEEV